MLLELFYRLSTRIFSISLAGENTLLKIVQLNRIYVCSKTSTLTQLIFISNIIAVKLSHSMNVSFLTNS